MKLDIQAFLHCSQDNSFTAPSLECLVCDAQGLCTAEDVKTIVETAVLQTEQEKEKVNKMLIKRPNNKMMVQNYMRSHTLHYRRDFNQDMLVQKRQRDEQRAKLEKQQVIDLLPLTSLLASVDDGGLDLHS